jgi:hypothetical protein
MRAISAADAISPAIQRTRQFLFQPFSWGTFLKLGLVALVTEGLGGNFNSTTHGSRSSGHGPMVYPPNHLPVEWIAIAVFAVLLAMVISVFVFYLITRLRFAFFHCLIQNVKQIRPGWHLYAAQASRFFWMNLGVGFCFLVLTALIALPFVAGFVRLFHETPAGGSPDIAMMLALALPLIPLVLLLILTGVLLDLILRDFMLPHYALENATAGEAWRAVRSRIGAEKRQFLVYALLRLILPTIAGIAIFIVLIIPGLILAGAVGMVEYGIHTAFSNSTGAASVAGILLMVFFGVVAFGFALLASICLGGPLSTGVREFALIFYGGRYQALGEILTPPLASSASAPGSPSV